MGKLRFSAVIGVLALAAWTLVGCGGGSSSGVSGTGQVRVSLVDAPMTADEVNVDITSIQVHKAGGGWVTLKEYAEPLHVNLLDYRTGGSSLLLADAPLDAGHYTMVRLMLSGAEVVAGGAHNAVDLQNVSQNGVKCNGEFTVENGQMMILVLDFNADRSFVGNGSGGYSLHPVMAMSPVNIASKVTGKVVFKDAQGNDLPTPEGVVINIYPQGHSGEADLLVAGASVNTDGTFTFDVLKQGTYDLQVLQGDTVVKSVSDVTVSAPTADLGTIEITPAAQ